MLNFTILGGGISAGEFKLVQSESECLAKIKVVNKILDILLVLSKLRLETANQDLQMQVIEQLEQFVPRRV